MCEFCVKHHPKRKKWFLDKDNFKEELLEDKKRIDILQKIAGYDYEYWVRDMNDILKWGKYPLVSHLINQISKRFKPAHSGQVITLDDALEIVELADNHVVFPCFCRRFIGLKEKVCCLNFGPMRDLYRLSSPGEKMEEIDAEEAKLRIKEWHTEGLVHQILYAAAPFPIAICNCERKYCVSIKYRTIFNIKSALYKGHEVAVVDPLRCKCETYTCITRCQFGAMYVDRYDNKVVIDPTKCFGCGLCVNTCKYSAITLKPKGEVLGPRIQW